MGQYGTAGDTGFSVLSGRAASRPTSRPEFSSRPYVERRDHRPRARSPQVTHNRVRVLDLESHSASTRSNSNNCEHEGGRKNNTTSIPLQRLPPAVSRTTRYDTGCS